MGDIIVVTLVAGMIFFMIKRGGCCGGHGNGEHDQSKENQSCCRVDNKDIKDEK
ncbi:hypothetical protein Amet_3273 [Alkaliphilus metalliredigens QYMF]|uniref:Uncharacterized protein n=1 Tax=Alkaliphilus metalliredigens (strain QYMF) TaxID=293826 RepID=A6TT92_ALKMQ|nr:hypothetical protein [Alkaliphilus metalliredigens]ABR49410.1 hypothetical protein Amet_3273 [Alkaliphilus metalliredigens QYMF]